MRCSCPSPKKVVDLAIDVLDARVGNHGGTVAVLGKILRCLDKNQTCALRFQSRGRSPCQDSAAEIVYHRLQIRARTVEQFDDGHVDVPVFVGFVRYIPDLESSFLAVTWHHHRCSNGGFGNGTVPRARWLPRQSSGQVPHAPLLGRPQPVPAQTARQATVARHGDRLCPSPFGRRFTAQPWARCTTSPRQRCRTTSSPHLPCCS
jgi:hypothetical protein